MQTTAPLITVLYAAAVDDALPWEICERISDNRLLVLDRAETYEEAELLADMHRARPAA